MENFDIMWLTVSNKTDHIYSFKNGYIATNKVNKQTALNAVISKLYVADNYVFSLDIKQTVLNYYVITVYIELLC